MSNGNRGFGLDNKGSDTSTISGRGSFVDEMSNALASDESPSFERSDESDPVVNMADMNVDDDVEQGSNPPESEAAQSVAAESAAEWHTFKADGKSKRFNLADKEAIKKILPLAEGARRWQSERDSWQSKYKEIEKPYGDLKSNWDRLETAFQREGIEGVLDIIQGKPGASKEYWESKYQERLAYERAPAHEQARIDHERMIDELRREKAKYQADAEERQTRLTKMQEAETETQMMADLRPHFNSFRFDGKLGDKEAESEYNQMVWDKTVDSLAQITAAGAPLNAQTIRYEFKKTYDRYAKVLKVNQDASVKAAVSSAQNNAKKALASSVRSSSSASGSDKKVDTGSSAQSLSNAWGKLFGVK